ncbi:nuclear transport factor 2 family protein [Phenylobacterium sp. LH3H17]|uniref:nuclear transport factor 2 family protein n=1 Tax=Phenylobacterium sp. LH3H17 TaxID=2903901 RepID=UPI0020C96E26|nr:nuclear transport factor 2 family protein [Phenylobacterium sp. LH3H17]UTP40858.1 nuclear transport factor 2 family protein [Phenylobacterium sp. LH3H17]
MLKPAVLALVLAVAGPVAAQVPAAAPRTADETAVLEADARQRDAVAKSDLAAIAQIAHPNLRVNAPNNRILTRQDLIRMVGSGDIRNDVFERTPETVVITGDVGVVMGREVVYPGAASEQARMYGQKTLNRRYTNIYLREGGAWRHLARHANVIP